MDEGKIHSLEPELLQVALNVLGGRGVIAAGDLGSDCNATLRGSRAVHRTASRASCLNWRARYEFELRSGSRRRCCMPLGLPWDASLEACAASLEPETGYVGNDPLLSGPEAQAKEWH